MPDRVTVAGGRPARRRPRCAPRASGTVLLALGLASALAASPATTRAQARWLPRLELDNDFYNVWRRSTHRPDEEYTNGIIASLESMDGSWWGPRFARDTPDCRVARPGESCRSTRITLGQKLYTPNLDRAPYEVADWQLERPYFGWLYATETARIASPRTLRSLSLSVGVTGPPAGGRLAQGIAHSIGYADMATGWDTQIGFEPGIVMDWRERLLAASAGGDRGAGLEITPELAASLGNVRTHAEAGGTVRLGWNLSHPWSPAEWTDRATVEWWVTAGGRYLGVARDMSLDGTWRHPERRVDRVPGVGQYEFGAGIRYAWLVLDYRAVTRSREYRTGPEHHAWSAVMLSISRPALPAHRP